MASTYLTRTVPSDGNRKIWTWSAWVKGQPTTPTNSMSGQALFSVGTSIQNRTHWFISDGYFTFRNEISDTQKRLITNRTFVDPNGWYHLVLAVDTTQATASNRVKLYVNGEQVTSFSTEEYPNQNDDTFVNNNQEHRIGSTSWTAGSYWDGLMSHVHFCDGTQLAPTVFGSTDSTTGEWKINTSPSFTPGTNGFTILKDGNTITDQSANSNNWSLGGGTLTKTEDNPSNVFATLNSLTIGGTAATLGNGNNSIVGGANNAEWYAASTIAPSTGKWYVEIRNDFASGQSADMIVGFTTNLIDVKNEAFPGKEPHSLGLWSSGPDVGDIKIDQSVVSNQYTGSWDSTNTILGMALDLDNKIVYFSINGVWQSSANPSAGSGGYDFSSSLTPFEDNYFIAIGSYYNSLTINKCSVNFGNGYFGTTAVSSAGTNASGIGIFEYDVPTGYTALSTKGLNL